MTIVTNFQVQKMLGVSTLTNKPLASQVVTIGVHMHSVSMVKSCKYLVPICERDDDNCLFMLQDLMFENVNL